MGQARRKRRLRRPRRRRVGRWLLDHHVVEHRLQEGADLEALDLGPDREHPLPYLRVVSGDMVSWANMQVI
jgi:hypothetical protein